MTDMSTDRWKVTTWIKSNPRCVFCGTITEQSVVFCVEENIIRGWRCPKCGFALLHPNEIPKVMELLRQTKYKLKI